MLHSEWKHTGQTASPKVRVLPRDAYVEAKIREEAEANSRETLAYRSFRRTDSKATAPWGGAAAAREAHKSEIAKARAVRLGKAPPIAMTEGR